MAEKKVETELTTEALESKLVDLKKVIQYRNGKKKNTVCQEHCFMFFHGNTSCF